MTRRWMNKPGAIPIAGQVSEPTCNLPLASKGLISYRYRGQYGWIMIGATHDTDALKEAGRSTDAPILRVNLQVWDGSQYVPTTP
jgi:hypothetical protein